jgi:3-hydroxybutyryl-CoA dehydrogenase
MPLTEFRKDPITIGIIGAGIMGRGIAQVAASAGINVIINDVNEAATEEAVSFIFKMIDRAVGKGRMSATEADVSKGCVNKCASLTDLADVDLVIEAVIEKLEVKQPLFRELEKIVSPECILATNTSSLSVTAIATACARPERVIGCHFFNPVPLMKLVEVIGGVKTASRVIEQILHLVERMGHTPVVARDSPGFLVNHMGRGMNTEGLRILAEGIASPPVIDAVMRDCAGFRMGPFELMDLTALDVTCPVSELVYEQFYHEPRLRPTPELKLRFTAGILGRKTGEGFYVYAEGNKLVPPEPQPPALDTCHTFWVSRSIPAFADKIINLLQTAGINIDEGEQPAAESIAIVTPLGLDNTTTAIDEQLDPEQTIAVDMLLNTDKRVCLMCNPATHDDIINSAWAAFAASGRTVSLINDSAGCIAQRMVANIINTACDIAQQGIARAQDIDTAAQLGLGYPAGPLAMGDKIGPAVVLEILENMQAVYGDPRYRPSPWLRRRAMLGLSLLHDSGK